MYNQYISHITRKLIVFCWNQVENVYTKKACGYFALHVRRIFGRNLPIANVHRLTNFIINSVPRM